MNLTQREVTQKPEKHKPDPAYLRAVRALPCIICSEFGMRQNSPTEAHHVKSGRYSSVKTCDRAAIPLCHSHHNKLRPYPGDEDKVGFHNAQETWEALYGPDHEWSAVIRDRILGDSE